MTKPRIIAALITLALFGCQQQPPPGTDSGKASVSTNAPVKQLPVKSHAENAANIELLKSCEARFSGLKEKYGQFIATKQYWKAAGVLRTCANVWPTEEISKMIAEAEIQEHLSVINNPKAKKLDKQAAMERLVIDYPEQGKPYEKFVPKPDPVPTAPQVFAGHSASIRNLVSYCANLAGIPSNEPGHRITKAEMTVLTDCVDQHTQHLQRR